MVLYPWHKEFSECFAEHCNDLAFDDEFFQNISDLKTQFEQLSADEQQGQLPSDYTSLNCEITLKDVKFSISKAKLGKAFLLVRNKAIHVFT